MKSEEYQAYVRGLKATDVLSSAINQYLKSSGCLYRIRNCWLDSKGEYGQFKFQVDYMGKDQSVTDLLSKLYKEE